MSRVRYVACMFATKSARRPEGLELLDVWDELSPHRVRSSGGPCVRRPAGAEAIEIVGLVGGSRWLQGGRRRHQGDRGVAIMRRGHAGGIRYLWGQCYGCGAYGGTRSMR